MTAWLSSEATAKRPLHTLTEKRRRVSRSSPDMPITLAPKALKWSMAAAKARASSEQPSENAAGKKYSTTGPWRSAWRKEKLKVWPANAAVVVKSGADSPTASAARAPAGTRVAEASDAARTDLRFSMLTAPRAPNAASAHHQHRLALCRSGAWPVRLVWLLALGLLAALLGGCSTLAPRDPLPRSSALPAQAGHPLVDVARASAPPEPGLSGFRLLPHGAFALDARLQLVQRAQRSIDLQYYLLENDATGRLLLQQLRQAADRGVRVRVLLDDLFTDRNQQLLSDLSAHPGVEVRLFNPFCCVRQSGLVLRSLASLREIRRVNHRMHNKLLVADGAMAVVGGRNIADEYFLRNELQNFVDLDALVLGRAVPDLAALFDEYWNASVAYPIGLLVPVDDDETPAARLARFDVAVSAEQLPGPLPVTDVLGYGPVGEEIDDGRLALIWGPTRVYADPPDKRHKTAAQAVQDSLAYEAMMAVWQAERELVITSPYLIPGQQGIAAFAQLADRRVRTTVLTNSLAATDEPLVHTGYARYRVPLLRLGVDLYELSPQRTRRERRLGLFGSSIGRLHAKTAIIDRRTVFIGSMNLDPRSASQNTELGLFIDSPPLARELQRVVNISRLQSAYRVRLAPDGRGLQWLSFDDDREMVLTVEPESSLWQRVYNMLVAPLVPEQLL